MPLAEQPHTQTPTAAPHGRLGGLDVARIVAAIAIVGFHTLPYPPVSWPLWAALAQEIGLKWAVPFFFAASGYLHGRSRRAAEPGWLRERLMRLGVPYVLWTTLRLVDLEPVTPLTLFAQYVLCAPTSTLWFVWTLMLCTAIAWWARKVGMSTGVILVVGISLAVAQATITQFAGMLGAFGEALVASPWYTYQSPLLWLWVYAVGLWLADRSPARADADRPSVRPLLAWAAALAVVGVVAVRYALEGPGAVDAPAYHFAWGWLGLWQGAFGIAALLVALAYERCGGPRVARLAGLSLGIYLVHPALIRVVRMGAGRFEVLDSLARSPLLMWAVVAAASIAIVVVVARIPVLRRFVA